MNSNINNTSKSDLLNSIDTPETGGYGIDQAAEILGTPARSGGSRTHGCDQDEGELDTSLTNRVSNKYKPDYFQALRWGIDSLYLSFSGELYPDQEAKLESLKKLAQHDQLAEQALAQFQINEHLFEVKDKGTGMFPFILEDNCFRIQLSRRRAKSMPMAYVKISSEYLTHKPVLEVVDDLTEVLSVLGVIESQPKVSRIDLFVDFSSNENMYSWHRNAWVTRSEKIHQYAIKGEFSGWSIGMGSGMSARLYNKVLEIVTSNKGYLVPLWNEAGWDGVTPVWRLEFEIKRDILVQFDVQVLSTTLSNLNGLWSYATTEWLKLTIPSEGDSNRSRWPIHPLWVYLSSVDFETSGGALSREFSPQRIPSDQRLFDFGFSVISSYMAREGMTDLYEGVEAYYRGLYHHLNNRALNVGASFDDYVNERVAVKAKRFNSILNKLANDDHVDSSDEYRKQSDGE